jgi:hypothetical protein
VITTDALHTQHGHGSYLTGHGAHYLAVVKMNHPGLYAQVKGLPGRDIPLEHRPTRQSPQPARDPAVEGRRVLQHRLSRRPPGHQVVRCAVI